MVMVSMNELKAVYLMAVAGSAMGAEALKLAYHFASVAPELSGKRNEALAVIHEKLKAREQCDLEDQLLQLTALEQ